MSLSKMSELRPLRQLFDLRFQAATRQAVASHKYKHARHKLAQLKTLQRERELEAKATA
jgi:large subunit ribosomal protein L29